MYYFQEIVVVCHDSDMEFWADSESSDNESDSTTDPEISEKVSSLHVRQPNPVSLYSML